MSPRERYRIASSYGWTRIDMLIHIYEQTINSLRAGQRILEQNGGDLFAARIDAQRKILLIVDGLALDQGGTPMQVLRLCLFALEQVRSDSAESWASAAKVLETVRDGFVEIREEARAAERDGLIPALQLASA
ncbi:MAG: hypothetical protein R3C19_20720 [Planctomycetaceae bacterium]